LYNQLITDYISLPRDIVCFTGNSFLYEIWR